MSEYSSVPTPTPYPEGGGPRRGRRRRRRGGRNRHRGHAGGGMPMEADGFAPAPATDAEAGAAMAAGVPWAGAVRAAEEAPPPVPEDFVEPAPADLYKLPLLELMREGHGFLRSPANLYYPTMDDPYVAVGMVRQYGLRDGCLVDGEVGPPKRPGQNPQLVRVRGVCGMRADLWRSTKPWDSLTVVDPDRKIDLTSGQNDVTARIIDLMSPIGFGQRALITSPPRAGKTVILQKVAQAVMGGNVAPMSREPRKSKRFDPPLKEIRARQMGKLQRGEGRWDVLIELARDDEIGALRGRIHFVSGIVHRISGWIFLEWSAKDNESRFFEFSAQELWNLLD